MTKHLAFSVTIHDCEVQTFAAGGPGGQNQNKRHTGVRIIHHPSGARVECREERSQLQNKKRAWRRLAQHPKFKFWVQEQLHHQDAKVKPQNSADTSMKPENLKVEYRQNGRWTRVE